MYTHTYTYYTTIEMIHYVQFFFVLKMNDMIYNLMYTGI